MNSVLRNTNFNFAGRRKRSTFIILLFLYGIINVCWINFGSYVFTPFYSQRSILFEFIFWGGLLIILFLMLNNYALRFHDLGMSGFWTIGLGVPFLNFILLAFLIFKKGEAGGNRFGPDPITGSNERILEEKIPSIESQKTNDNFLNNDPSEALAKYKKVKKMD